MKILQVQSVQKNPFTKTTMRSSSCACRAHITHCVLLLRLTGVPPLGQTVRDRSSQSLPIATYPFLFSSTPKATVRDPTLNTHGLCHPQPRVNAAAYPTAWTQLSWSQSAQRGLTTHTSPDPPRSEMKLPTPPLLLHFGNCSLRSSAQRLLNCLSLRTCRTYHTRTVQGASQTKLARTELPCARL